MSEKQKDIETILYEALEYIDLEERRAYLDKTCGIDTPLRKEVDSLLKAYNSKDLLKAPADLLGESSINITETAGTIIGRYKLLEKIGEGGMATVYMAEQEQPIRRQVALKIIKLGMDTKQVIARFEVERQALAIMDHPHIAKVLDAGTTETGRPYFVMELIKGKSITEYCDEHELSIEDRLNLFIQVCETVHHAHQKGIIHRDIKPSNILVSLQEQRAELKIIDFGVAKAISQLLTERTFFTEQGQLIGTPEYMSPEQAEINAQDIDIRTDIYSLGMLLYELLTGALPFDPKSLREVAFNEIQRIIREEDPPRPSTRLSSLGEEAKTAAEKRHTEVGNLTRRLHQELEWIPLKALRKDRRERYQSASEFAEDIHNYMNGTPLIAGPEPTIYRLKKFIRRHQALVTGITSVLLVLTVGIVATTVFAVRESRARNTTEKALQIAEEAQKLGNQQRLIAEQRRGEAEAAREEAERQAKIAQAVNDFLNDDLLTSANPSETIKADVSVREILDRASKKIPGRFIDEPLVEAAIRKTIGDAYYYLTEYDLAVPHIKSAYEIYRNQYKMEHYKTTEALTVLCWLYEKLGKFSEAESLNRQLLEVKRRLFGPEDKKTLNTMVSVASCIKDPARSEEAISLLTYVVELKRSQGLKAAVAKKSLALRYMALGRYQEAESLLLEAVKDGYRTPSKRGYLSYLNYKSDLASLYIKIKRYDQAELILTDVIENKSKVLDEEHPRTLITMNRLAGVYKNLGRFEEAVSWYTRILEIRIRVLGEKNQNTQRTMNSLAWLQATCPEAGIRNGTQALVNATKVCELTNWKNRVYINTLAAAYAEVGDFTNAIKWQQVSIDLMPATAPSKTREINQNRLKLYQSGKPYREERLSNP